MRLPDRKKLNTIILFIIIILSMWVIFKLAKPLAEKSVAHKENQEKYNAELENKIQDIK